MKRLHFKNGEFKILVLSDVHECMTNPIKHHDVMSFIEKSLESTMPDLVVFCGDNATANNKKRQEKAIESIVSPIVKRKIPFACVFGNHDDEYCKISKEEQLKIYQSQGFCLSVKGNCFTGVCNFNLPLYDEKNEKIIFNLWFMDSNTYDKENGGYAYVADDQLSWYQKTAEELRRSQGYTVKSILFQHMTVPEEYSLLKKCKKETAHSVKGDCGYDGYYCIDSDNATMEGMLLEGPCPPTKNNGEFSKWKETGDIILAVFGHDHINTFSGEYDGITLMQAGGAGFNTYHKGVSQSASLIKITESDLSVKREHINFSDLIGTPLTYKLFPFLK